jgi:hypothetical protein
MVETAFGNFEGPTAFSNTEPQIKDVAMLNRKLKFLFIAVAFLLTAAGQPRSADDNRPVIVVRGRVISQYGPVENARVRLAGEKNYTLTDRQGRYELQSAYLPGTRLMVTAGKEGWFNNGQIVRHSGRTRDIFLNPVYLNDQPGYRFISPVTCSRCHVKLTRYYDQSKMAHTTSNPKVLNMLYGTDAFNRVGIGPGYKLDNPNSDGNCVSCHAPSAATAGPWVQDLKSVLRSGHTEWDGISCDYCHKVRKVISDKSQPSGTATVLERQSSRRGNSILVFGPYDDVTASPMAASYNPVFDKGQFCSQCHSHYKKLDNGETWDAGMVYTAAEWKGLGLKDNTYRAPRLGISRGAYPWNAWSKKKEMPCSSLWKSMSPSGGDLLLAGRVT